MRLKKLMRPMLPPGLSAAAEFLLTGTVATPPMGPWPRTTHRLAEALMTKAARTMGQ